MCLAFGSLNGLWHTQAIGVTFRKVRRQKSIFAVTISQSLMVDSCPFSGRPQDTVSVSSAASVQDAVFFIVLIVCLAKLLLWVSMPPYNFAAPPARDP